MELLDSKLPVLHARQSVYNGPLQRKQEEWHPVHVLLVISG